MSIWLLLLASSSHAETTYTAVSADDVRVRTPVAPKRPQTDDGTQVHSCLAHFQVDARGKPVTVSVSGCPDSFRLATERVAWDWRFAPYVVDGESTPVEFDRVFDFAAQGDTYTSVSVAKPRVKMVAHPKYAHVDAVEKRVKAPDYPEDLWPLGLQVCDAIFTIKTDGRISQPLVTRCDEAMHATVLEAVARYRYRPIEVDGEPTPTEFAVRVRFRPPE